MKTRFKITKGYPDERFWDQFSALWQNSIHPSAFQAPHFIRYLAGLKKDDLVIFSWVEQGELLASTFFYKKGREYHFLSDLKTDHNFVLIHQKATDDQIKLFFTAWAITIKERNWSFRLNNQPFWASYMPLLIQALEENHLFWMDVPYNACLVLDKNTPEELFKACNKQKLRQKMHRLEDMGKLEFEVFRGREELDPWLEEYFSEHIARWADTQTPSQFGDLERRDFYKRCIEAWIEDGILVRFALKLNGRRISFVTALLENGSLVHHSTTYDVAYTPQSPGLIIIRSIAQWMMEHNMHKMEFGDGGEAYKYLFTHDELPLHQFFISPATKVSFRIKAGIIRFMREHKKLHDCYFEKLRPVLLRFETVKNRIS